MFQLQTNHLIHSPQQSYGMRVASGLVQFLCRAPSVLATGSVVTWQSVTFISGWWLSHPSEKILVSWGYYSQYHLAI